jgi:hypothetical protein
MEVKSLTSLEATFLSKFNEGNRTFDAIKAVMSVSEKTLNDIVETLIAKGVVRFNTANREYYYETPPEGDKVILDGNIMLPITVIKQVDPKDSAKSKLLVSRGAWYEFPIDFDIRRIIWNVQLPSNNKSTLLDLIRESVLKEKKSKLVQNPAYKQLVSKILPWSDNILLKINIVGEEATDVTVIFRDRLTIEGGNLGEFVEFRGFTVRSEIATKEMIAELTKTKEERDYSRIGLNRIFNFSDFIFSGNEIPYSSDGESINYAKITAIKGRFELTFYRFNNSGTTSKIDVQEYLDASEGIDKLRELFQSYAQGLISSSDILVEMAD